MRQIALSTGILLCLGWSVGCSSPSDKGSEPPPGPGDIVTVIGTGAKATDKIEDAQGNPLALPPTSAQLDQPLDISFAPTGELFVLDWNGHKIRCIHGDGLLYPFVGNGVEGDACESGYDATAKTCPALQAELNHPADITFDASGNAWIAAWHNSKIKRVDVATDRVVDACGSGGRDYKGDLGPCFSADGTMQPVVFDLPSGVAFDTAGNLFIADQSNQVVRRLGTDGIVNTVVGVCPMGGFGCPDGEGYDGDNGPATAAHLNNQVGQAALPSGKIAFDAQGNLFIADTYNHVVRKVTPGSDGILGSGEPSEEIITTVVGDHSDAYGGDGGPATAAQLSLPTDLAFAPDGTLYIADRGAHCIRRVGTDQIISTVAGECGIQGASGDGKAAKSALLDSPFGVTVGPDGALYIADTGNYRVRKILPGGS